jgi:hypothetical protein
MLKRLHDDAMKNRESNENNLAPTQSEQLLRILRSRFENNMHRHKGLTWEDVQARLTSNTEKLRSLNEMERTGGEPDVVGYDKKTGEFIFYDCSAESLSGRRSLCYDDEALKSRKEHKPKGSAVGMADRMDHNVNPLHPSSGRSNPPPPNASTNIAAHREPRSGNAIIMNTSSAMTNR